MEQGCAVGFELHPTLQNIFELTGLAIVPSYSGTRIFSSYTTILPDPVSTEDFQKNPLQNKVAELSTWRAQLPNIVSVTLSLPAQWIAQRTFSIPDHLQNRLSRSIHPPSATAWWRKVLESFQNRACFTRNTANSHRQGCLTTVYYYPRDRLVSWEKLFCLAGFPLYAIESFPFSLRRWMHHTHHTHQPLLYANKHATGLLACAPSNKTFNYCWFSDTDLKSQSRARSVMISSTIPDWMQTNHFWISKDWLAVNTLLSKLGMGATSESPKLSLVTTPYPIAYGAALNFQRCQANVTRTNR